MTRRNSCRRQAFFRKKACHFSLTEVLQAFGQALQVDRDEAILLVGPGMPSGVPHGHRVDKGPVVIAQICNVAAVVPDRRFLAHRED